MRNAIILLILVFATAISQAQLIWDMIGAKHVIIMDLVKKDLNGISDLENINLITKYMETTFLQMVIDGLTAFFKSVDWKFVGGFIVIMWLINEGTESANNFKWLNWLRNVPKGLRTFAGGILLAFGYAYLYDLFGKVNFASLIWGVLTGMVAWKLGVSALFDRIKNFFAKLTGSNDDKVISGPTNNNA